MRALAAGQKDMPQLDFTLAAPALATPTGRHKATFQNIIMQIL